MTRLDVNGELHDVEADPATPLLYVLRDNLGLNAAKFGCGPGQCGACVVTVDGEAIYSCLTPVSVLAGRKIKTVEGLGTVEKPGAMQCQRHRFVPVLVPAFPLTPGKAFTVTFFSPSENMAKPLTFKVGTPERVTVPAGVFQAYHIDVSGARVPLVMWVSVDTPRRVVKTEFVGQPFVFELVK